MEQVIIKTLETKFTSYLKLLDIFYVIKGLKPVARITEHDYMLEKKERLLSDYGLHVVRSDFKIVMEFSDGNYSNKGRKVDASSLIPGNYFVYVSKDEALAKEAKFAEYKDDHAALGKLLGYPACCIEFYLKNFKKESAGKLDFAVPVFRNTHGSVADFRLNIFSRYLDAGLISHFPHSFHCRPSLALAEAYHAAITEDDPVFAAEMAKVLKCGVIYSSQGLFLLFGIERQGFAVSFTEVKATKTKSELYQRLMKERQIKTLDNTSFVLGKSLYKNMHVMVFE